MGSYLNPKYNKFFESLNSEIYIDKSELIQETNSILNMFNEYSMTYLGDLAPYFGFTEDVSFAFRRKTFL